MYILIYLYIFVLKIIYFFCKLFKTKNKIVFISRQSNKPSLDFIMLEEEILKLNPSFETIMLTKKVEKNVKSVLQNTFIQFKQLYHLATSKICITDGYNISISTLKHKKSLKVFQIWHSLAAIKKFGYDSLKSPRDRKIARIMSMHKNYDYVNCSSEAMRHYFSNAFGYEDKSLYPLGLPRIDYLVTKEKILKKQIYNKYPEFKRKKVILYAPTFRDNNNYRINDFIKEIDFNKYILILKLHPNTKIAIDNNNIYTCKGFTALSLITVSDYIITDYSGISIEALALNKPVYLYVYDIEEYSKYPGLNLNLEEEFKSLTFKNPKKMYQSITKNSHDKKVIEKLKRKFIISTKGDITKNLAKFILQKGVDNNEDN